MPKFYQTKKFKDLNDKWSKKLEKSGFKDIEHDEEKLTAYSTRFCSHPDYVWDLRSAYYSMCESFLQNFNFESEHERVVWEYHTNGLSARGISKVLNKVKKNKTSYITVWRLVNKLETVMKTTYLLDYDEEDSEH